MASTPMERERVKRLSERVVLVSLVPLGLALAALGAREATREHRHAPASHGRATEFAPPPWFLLVSAAPGVDQSLRVDVERSSARVTMAEGQTTPREQRLRAEGTLLILADESLADVELELAPQVGTRSSGWPRDLSLHLRGVSARSRATAVPGVRTCSLRCSAILGGASREVILAVTWMRLPGQEVALQASARLARTPFNLPESWSGWMLRRDEPAVLGIDLVLRTVR